MKPIRILLCALSLTAVVVPALASIRVYDVDPVYRQEVYNILTNLLNRETPTLSGRVQLLPSGQIVVDTMTDERQAEVAAVLEAIANSEPEETPTVTLRYWVLLGVPDTADAPALPSTLDGVVAELEAVHGELGVRILDAATVSGRSGESAALQNDRWEIVQHANVGGEGERLNARVEIEHELQELDANLSLTRGEFVVLGAGTSAQPVENGVLALIVSWPAD